MKKKEILFILLIIAGIIFSIISAVQISETIEITDVTGYLTNSSNCKYLYIGNSFSSSTIPSGYVELTYEYDNYQFNTTIPAAWLCATKRDCCAGLVKNKNTIYVFIETENPWIVNIAKLDDTWISSGYILLLILSITFTLVFILVLVYYIKYKPNYSIIDSTGNLTKK